MTAMGNRFGVQGLDTEPNHSIQDVECSRTSEESRPTEVPDLDHRSPVDLALRQYGDRRRYPETPIPNKPISDEVTEYGDGAEGRQNSQVQYSEIGSSAQTHIRTLDKSLVRSHIEYANSVWNNHFIENHKKLKKSKCELLIVVIKIFF